MEGQWRFRGGGGSHKPKFLKESMGLNWNFQRGEGIQTKKSSVGGVWIFTGTTHAFINVFLFSVLPLLVWDIWHPMIHIWDSE